MSIALDAMGGDYGPSVIVPAALRALKNYPHLTLILVGDTGLINAQLQAASAKPDERLILKHASQQIAMDESPALALRNKKDSSMRVAIDLVKDGTASACVSAGNTGALMATARFVLKTLPGIDRPAIISAMPTFHQDKPVRMLDLGANVDSKPEHLLQFAVMGSVLSTASENIASPKVGLLNIGHEDIKGNDLVKQAAILLRNNAAIQYAGYIEADEIFKGNVDVVVCDGFVGNVALKSMEGALRLITHFTKDTFRQSPFTRLAGLCALPLLRRLRKRMDPARYNGASLLGLQGIVIKSHGGTNTLGFYSAIEEAVTEVKKGVPQQIRAEVEKLLSVEKAFSQ